MKRYAVNSIALVAYALAGRMCLFQTRARVNRSALDIWNVQIPIIFMNLCIRHITGIQSLSCVRRDALLACAKTHAETH